MQRLPVAGNRLDVALSALCQFCLVLCGLSSANDLLARGQEFDGPIKLRVTLGLAVVIGQRHHDVRLQADAMDGPILRSEPARNGDTQLEPSLSAGSLRRIGHPGRRPGAGHHGAADR